MSTQIDRHAPMTINSAADVIAVAEARGFKVMLNPGPPPMPFLRGKEVHATAALLAALVAWRLEIIEEVKRRDEGNA